MEVDGGIVVGLPLNFIVIIAGPSFFWDWESEFLGVGGGRTTFRSFASSVCGSLTWEGELALSDDIWKLRFLCRGVADRGRGNLPCRTTLGSFASSVWVLLTEGIRFAGWRPSTVFCVSSAFQSFALSLSRCSSNTLTKPLAHFCKQSSASVFVSVFSSLLTQKRVHERKRRWWCSPS